MKKPKIALCIPNLIWQEPNRMSLWHLVPYGICLIAAMVRDLCQVEIIDANKENLTLERFEERVAEGGYDLVGFSVLMDSFALAAHQAAGVIKKRCPGTTVVMGGVYPTMQPERALEDKNVDYICLGEGEYLVPALLKYLFHNGERPEHGLGYRFDGQTIIQPPPPFIEDLDALPLPAYDLIDFPSYATWSPGTAPEGPPLMPLHLYFLVPGLPSELLFLPEQAYFRTSAPQAEPCKPVGRNRDVQKPLWNQVLGFHRRQPGGRPRPGGGNFSGPD